MDCLLGTRRLAWDHFLQARACLADAVSRMVFLVPLGFRRLLNRRHR